MRLKAKITNLIILMKFSHIILTNDNKNEKKFFHRKDYDAKISYKQKECTNNVILSHLLIFSRQHSRLENNGRKQETSEA